MELMDAALNIIGVTVVDALAMFLWIAWLMKKDLYAERKGNTPAVLIFTLAGMMSAPLALLFYSNRGLDGVAYMLGYDTFLYYYLVVGLVEEAAKLIVFIAISSALGTVKDTMDGVVQGAAVGLGFAIVENFIYGLDYGFFVAIIRSVTSITGHMTYAAIAAYGFVSMRFGKGSTELRRRLYGVRGLLIAIFLHGTHNSLLLLGVIFPTIGLDIAALFMLASFISRTESESPYKSFPAREWAQAVSVISSGIRHDAGNKDFYLRRGYYYLCGGHYGKATEDFATALRLSPDKRFANACLSAANALSSNTAVSRELLDYRFQALSPSQRRSFRDSLARGLKGDKRRIILGQLDSYPSSVSRRDSFAGPN